MHKLQYGRAGFRARNVEKLRRWSVATLLLSIPLLVWHVFAYASAVGGEFIAHGGIAARAAHEQLTLAMRLEIPPAIALLSSVVLGYLARLRSWREVWWTAISFLLFVAVAVDWLETKKLWGI